MNTIKTKFKNVLVEQRKEKDMVQKQVAAELDLKLSTYQAYERGAAEPNLSTLEKLFRLYGEEFKNKLFQ